MSYGLGGRNLLLPAADCAYGMPWKRFTPVPLQVVPCTTPCEKSTVGNDGEGCFAKTLALLRASDASRADLEEVMLKIESSQTVVRFALLDH